MGPKEGSPPLVTKLSMLCSSLAVGLWTVSGSALALPHWNGRGQARHWSEPERSPNQERVPHLLG